MPQPDPVRPARCAVVDLGSNSVRLVVFEGRGRNPTPIFNEKAVLRLGRGLTATGRLNEDAVAQAVNVMGRYHAIARAMGADPFEVLATAAVRDAANGPDFVAAMQARMPGVPVRILSGEAEAELSAEGVLCGIPQAHGTLADIGGGSLELVRLDRGVRGAAGTLKLGVIRLSERAGGDLDRARAITEAELSEVNWLGGGGELYLVGGAFRALARVHMAQANYPLSIVHHYTIDAAAAGDLASGLVGASRRALDRLPNVPRRRAEDLPYAAVVLRRLLRATGAERVVFSANGLREGWYMRQVGDAARTDDPLLAAGRDAAAATGRDTALPEALIAWTAPLFPNETAAERRLREGACWMSDIGSHDHPEYRAEQACLRVARQPGVALDHPARAALGHVLAYRYEAEPDASYLTTLRPLLDSRGAAWAEQLGLALHLAYTLSAGTPNLLAGSMLSRDGARLDLCLARGRGVFAGEAVLRRLRRLAESLGVSDRLTETA